jgi:RimJ/RimL family protein N-acetyltransferase
LSLFDIDLRNSNAGLTIIIPDENEQGKGYGTESVKILCDYAFRFLGLNKVYCKTDNPYASKMYERIGFMHEGTLRKQSYRYGEYVDKLCFGLLRVEFVP